MSSHAVNLVKIDLFHAKYNELIIWVKYEANIFLAHFYKMHPFVNATGSHLREMLLLPVHEV